MSDEEAAAAAPAPEAPAKTIEHQPADLKQRAETGSKV
jgi:hypothetical protein